MYDVIVVGGGPAGLSAALMLGRCRRKVIVFDTGTPRNAKSQGIHGFLTRDGILPAEFLLLGRAELVKYGVELRDEEVIEARKRKKRFEVVLGSGQKLECRKLLIATGLRDILPPLDNISEFFGKSVFHCPYCDAWEVRDKPLAAYGKGRKGVGMALMLQTWSHQVSLFTDGPPDLKSKDRLLLAKARIQVYSSKIAALQGDEGRLEGILLADGTKVNVSAMFFRTDFRQQCKLAESFDCALSRKGTVKTDPQQETNVKGLYVAGDASMDMHMVAVAAAEGIKAAIAINIELQLEHQY